MGSILLFISGAEIFIIIIVVVILFGAKRIPDLAKGLGKGLSEFRKATDDIKREINQSDSGILKDAKEVKDTITETTQKVKRRIVESPISKDLNEAKRNINKM